MSPTETVERAMAQAPVMGITRLADVTGLDCIGIPVVMSIRPNSRSLAVSQGKGPTLADARASAVMESIELFHAEHIRAPLRLARPIEIVHEQALVEPTRLPRMRPVPVDDRQPFLWIEGVDVAGSEPIPTWVPHEVVHMNSVDMQRFSPRGRLLASSNGLASGNHIVEAVAQGVYEVVERDAAFIFALASPEQQARRLLALDTVDDAVCRDLLERFERAGVGVLAWDLSHDIGVPAFHAVIFDRDEHSLRSVGNCAGYGAHAARAVALARALTEAAQSRLTIISGARDDMGRRAYHRLQSSVSRAAMLELSTQAKPRSFSDAPTVEADTVNEELRFALDSLGRCGFEQVVVVDLSQKEIGIPVARVVIPGLEGIREGGAVESGPGLHRRMAEIDYLREPGGD